MTVPFQKYLRFVERLVFIMGFEQDTYSKFRNQFECVYYFLKLIIVLVVEFLVVVE